MLEENRELLIGLGIKLNRIRNAGKTLCPKCSHNRKNKSDPCLSVNVDLGVYRCHNCGWSGSVSKTTQRVDSKKEYVKPPFVNRTACSEDIVNWFFTRGITQQTLIDLGVSENNEWMPQTKSVVKTINFNYFRNGELVNIKYRDGNKNFKMFSGGELIFYNIDSIKDSDSVVIVEGEIDVLSLHEAGIKSVISVPNGASSSKNPNLEYLDSCIDLLNDKTKIIIATDADSPGLALRDELARRIGYHRCYKVDFGDEKDANDYLQKYGAEKLKEVFSDQNIKEFPIGGVITANDIWEDLEDLFKNGLERGDVTGTMPGFDKLVSFVPGQTMVVTGIPNHGKSPFTLNIAASLSVNCGWKWAIFSPEHKPLKIFVAKICELLLGRRMRKGIGFSDREKELAKDFIENHFFFVEPDKEDNSIENVLSIAESLVFRKGIRGLIMDPWNKFEHKMNNGESETMYVSRALDEIIRFGQDNSVFNIIIAHPTKIKKEGKLHAVPTLYDISGSSNWFNKPDWGITFYRNYETGNNEVYVQKAKWDHLGSQGSVEMRYNPANSRFSDLDVDYDNKNWLIPQYDQANIFAQSTPELFSNTSEHTESPF